MFADLVLINGKVTSFKKKGISVKDAVAVKGGKIAQVGKMADIQQLMGKETVIIDLKGRVVLPGFIDSHTHPAIWATWLAFEIDCSQAKSIAEIVEKIKEKVRQSPKGSWIRAYGYNDQSLVEKRHPSRYDLDKVAPENPVILKRTCWHVSVLNSLALKIMGISKETPDTSGGSIDRDPKNREPTGILREKALNHQLAWEAIPSYTVEELKQGLKLAFPKLLSWGLTTVHDALASPESIQAYQELKAKGELPLRLNLIINDEYKNQDLLQALTTLQLQSGFGDEWLKIIGVKFIADGSIGGHTAALHEPYVGEPKNFGILVTEPNILNEKVMKTHKNGLQVSIHAIGDRGIDVALDAIEMALNQIPKLDHRHRIEHCGVCTPKQLQRIKKINAFVSSSTSFLSSAYARDYFKKAIGEERMKWCYPHRSFIDYEIIAAGNSDLGAAPEANPLVGIYASVVRGNWKGETASDQSITVEEAIRSYTIDGALIGFDEKTRGSIEEGKLADLVVLSDDPFSVPPDQLKDIKVDVTIVNGEVKFQRENN